jgi:hypothetical protein
MYYLEKNFISNEDLLTVQKYITTINFHTKDNHVQLHDNLFNGGATFDIHTRGEMPDEVLNVFSKYSKRYWELVSSIQDEIKYHPPMFSKHYIARFRPDSQDGFHFADTRPQHTFGSYIYWNSDFDGGELCWENNNDCIKPNPGDLVFFEEIEENRHKISKIDNGYLYFSESWMSPIGTCPDPNVKYETVYWDDWEIKGFYE